MLERGSYIPLLSIPNDIYNSVDACTSAKDMWKRVERLMRGTIQNKVDKETRFTNEFDQFESEPKEALVSVYNCFAQLMNDLERNDMHFPIVTINTKFLNSLQPEWLKYVTQVRLAKRLTVDTFDDLFDYLQQFEKLVNVSRAKKLEKSHDPLALVAHTGLSSRNTSSYYVTHPTSVVDYEDEYQQDDVHTNSEDPLTFAMLNQAIIQGDRVNIQSRNSGNAGRNNRRAYVQEEIVEGSNAPNETGNVQRTLRTSSSGNTSTDEAGVILIDEQNDFLFADASRMEEIKELSANICLMARIQLADNTSDAGPSYDSAFISEVQYLSNTKNKEQMYPTHTKIINSTIGDDQIDSDIIFDSPNRNFNSGSIEKDTHVPDLCTLEQLARNAYQKAEKQQTFAQKVIQRFLWVLDTEDTLDDASKSQQKVYKKMNDPIAVANKQNCWTIDYAQINALYKDFVPQKELSAEQKYFPSFFIPSDKNSNATPSILVSMPKQLTPIVNELQFYFEFFKILFQRDIKEMKDVFESTKSELSELEKQNDFLKDQLLEVSLKHEVELSVLLNHECVDNSLHAENE
ncbi:hypothetical protein Tco_1170573 [Tanacetum coccineum]